MRGPRKNSLANVGGLDSYQIRGLEETFAVLDQLGTAAVGQALAQAMLAALRPVRDRARQLAPRSDEASAPALESGLLARAIVAKVTRGRGGRVYGKVGIVRNKHKRQAGVRSRGKHKGEAWFQDPARYAHLLEFGTRHAAARPFLRPAWDAARAAAIEEFRRKVSDVIGKWAKQGKLTKKLRAA